MQDRDVTVEWQLRDATGKVKESSEEVLHVPAMSAAWLDKVPPPQAALYEDHVSYTLKENGVVVSEGSVIFCPPKYYKFIDPQLSVRVEGDEVVVTAKGYAKDVAVLNAEEDLLLSDNYFDMEPGERRLKVLRGAADGLRVCSTYDIR